MLYVIHLKYVNKNEKIIIIFNLNLIFNSKSANRYKLIYHFFILLRGIFPFSFSFVLTAYFTDYFLVSFFGSTFGGTGYTLPSMGHVNNGLLSLQETAKFYEHFP